MTPRMRLAAALLLGLAACGGNDDVGGDAGSAGLCAYFVDAGPEAGPEAGVVEGCPEHQTCDTSGREARCVCEEGYSGIGCAECERGWREESLDDGGVYCDPVPIDCRRNPGVCEPGGECKEVRGVHVCDCQRGYGGRVCSRCASGFQDHDGDGTCEPSCGTAGLRCPGRRECSDESGEAECVCIEGYAGESCDTCAPGYRATGVGGCLPTCDVAGLDCGAHGACADLDGPPVCVCDVGYAGDGCAECAETHRDDGMGGCIGDPPEGHGLLATAGGERGEPVLGAVDPVGGVFVPLAMLERTVSSIAYDAASDRLFGVSSGTLVEIDRRYGTVTDLATTAGTSFRSGLAWDSARELLYTTDAGGELVSVDPTTGTVSTLSLGGSFRPYDATLTYDAADDLLLGARSTSSRFVVDLSTPAVQMLTPLAIDHPVERLAIALDGASGLPWAVADGTPSETERLDAVCREIAAAMGYAIPGSVAVGGYGEPDPEMPGAPITLSYDAVDPPLVMYGSYGDRTAAPRVVRVSTAHPDAVVCIVTYEEPLHVLVEAAAQLHYLILVSYEPNLTLQVEDDFQPKIEGVPPIRVRVSDAPVDPSLLGPPELVRFYDGAAWSELGVRSDPWSSSTGWLRPSVVAVDWDSGAVFERAVGVRSFAGGLTGYGGAP